MTTKILVSACLLGRPVRYNGSAKTLLHPALERWKEEGRIVSVCPELAAGFPIPRPAAEIADGQTGDAVLAGQAHILEETGRDVTTQFVIGAQAAVDLAREHDCKFALLIDGSPSCGSNFIYDGTFTGQKHEGAGATAALLRKNGVEVFSDTDIERLLLRLSEKL